MRYRDHHILVGIEVLRIEFLCRKSDFSPPRITVLLLHLKGLVLDDTHLELLVRKDILAVSDELHELVILALELLPLESCELTQTHLHDRRRLYIGESECSHELVLGILNALRSAYDVDYLVDDIKSLKESLEDMRPLLSLLEVESGPSYDDIMPVSYEILDKVLEVQRTRTSVHESHVVHREA